MKNLTEGNALHSAYMTHNQHVENLLFSFVRFFAGFLFFSWAACGVVFSLKAPVPVSARALMLLGLLSLSAIVAFRGRYVVGAMQSYNGDYLTRRFHLERAITKDLEVTGLDEVVQDAQQARPKVVESIQQLFLLVGYLSLAAAVVIPLSVVYG